jgi:hypothetical protein
MQVLSITSLLVGLLGKTQAREGEVKLVNYVEPPVVTYLVMLLWCGPLARVHENLTL